MRVCEDFRLKPEATENDFRLKPEATENDFQLKPEVTENDLRLKREAMEMSGGETDFAPLADVTPSVRAIGAAVASGEAAGASPRGRTSDRLVGTLVHRLVERLGFDADAAAAREAAAGLLRPEEIVELGSEVFRLKPETTVDTPETTVDTPEATVDAPEAAVDTPEAGAIEAAVAAYAALARRDDVRTLYASGEARHEVPFTMSVEGVWLRGTIDCLVLGVGHVTVLELKTGRPRPEHRAQVELYAQAAAQMFPGHLVDARLIYASDVARPA